MAEGGDKDKVGGGLLAGKKRARLLPEQPFEKVTPEAGESTRTEACLRLLLLGYRGDF